MMKRFVFLCALISCVQFLNAGYYIGDYYVSHPLKLTWWHASRFCTFYGQDLIDIRDECEYHMIVDVIIQVRELNPKFAENIWTSGVRFNDDRWFYWENTGMPVIYASWGDGEPSMGTDENFIALWYDKGFQLGDQSNTAKHVFICRKRDMPLPKCDDNLNMRRYNFNSYNNSSY